MGGMTLLACLATYRRGEELYLYGTYPCIVTRDTFIGIEDAPMVPVTNILAFGQSDEQDYTDYVRATDLSFFKLPNL